MVISISFSRSYHQQPFVHDKYLDLNYLSPPHQAAANGKAARVSGASAGASARHKPVAPHIACTASNRDVCRAQLSNRLTRTGLLVVFSIFSLFAPFYFLSAKI